MAAFVVGSYALVKQILSCDDDDDDLAVLLGIAGMTKSLQYYEVTIQQYLPDTFKQFFKVTPALIEHLCQKLSDCPELSERPIPLEKKFTHLRGTNTMVKSVNVRVFTNQMLTDGLQTKTNPKTSPEQSEINKTNVLTKFHEDRQRNVPSRVFTNKSHLSNQIIYIKLLTKFGEDRNKTNIKLLTKLGEDRI
ncbi:hypothetical protein DPMN_167313 [Dreissena polymorpha]|uniref:Uncharacterized protein n=1 Tax=Dreissena polymorpha TaxID=45954 RepID=A0A9D4IUX7_DREPO|nr:hypothetical protein DPMN_167313 [Dreissena polymorpha]